MTMKNMNYPLLLGSIIVITLMLVVSYPALFTTNDPLFEESPKYIETKIDGEWVEKFGHNPMPPNKENILGTDDAGRDVYARLIYGTRNTLKLALLIAILRILIALPLGLAAGMGVRIASGIIKIFNTFFTAIPMLLFSYIVLNIGYFRVLEMDKAILPFAIVLTLVGWAKLAGMLEDATKRVMEEDFIEGEVAIGKTKLQIAYQNILPHIIPTSVSLFFKETAMALFLIAQLAVLYVFVGISRQIRTLAFKANYEMILEPEWGGSLSRITSNIKKYEAVYWLSLYPILTFSIAILGINLTGEGLRIEFQKRESRVISSIRRTYYQISPKIFISQIKDIKKYYKPVLLKLLIIIGVIAYIIIPWHPSQYQFDLDYAKLHLEELAKDQYGGRVSGSEGGYLAGEYIINTLKDYGYEVETLEIPLEVEAGEVVPKALTPMVIESGWIKLKKDDGEEKTYNLHKDFAIATLSSDVFLDNHRDQINFKGIAAISEKAVNIPEETDYFIIDTNFYGYDSYRSNVQNHITIGSKILNYNIRFILTEGLNEKMNTYTFKTTDIIPYGDLREELKNGYGEVEINFEYPQLPKYPGRNITAFLPGKNKTKEEPGELIIIGAIYDGIHTKGTDSPYAMTATPAAIALELARAVSLIEEPLEKSIQFIFWDNDSEYLVHSIYDGSHHYSLIEQIPIEMAMTHRYYYFDISYPGFKEDQNLNLITYPPQRGDKNSYLMGLHMDKRLKQMKVKYRRFYYDYGGTKALMNMRLNALTSVGVGNPYVGGINNIMDTLENVNFNRIKNIGQLLLDTLTMNPYIME